MINILTLALVVSLVVSAVLAALLCLAVIFSIVGRVRGAQKEIGLPDHEESKLGQALEEFLASEAAVADPDGIIGSPARYHSVRLGENRPAVVMAYLGRGIYNLAIENAAREVVTIRRHRRNFQLV